MYEGLGEDKDQQTHPISKVKRCLSVLYFVNLLPKTKLFFFLTSFFGIRPFYKLILLSWDHPLRAEQAAFRRAFSPGSIQQGNCLGGDSTYIHVLFGIRAAAFESSHNIIRMTLVVNKIHLLVSFFIAYNLFDVLLLSFLPNISIFLLKNEKKRNSKRHTCLSRKCRVSFRYVLLLGGSNFKAV